jgi:hypothetical protein
MNTKRIKTLVFFWFAVILFVFPACNFLPGQNAGLSTNVPEPLPSNSPVVNVMPVATQTSEVILVTSIPSPASSEPISVLPSAQPTQQLPSIPPVTGDLFAIVDVAADDVLNIRSGAGTSFPIIGNIPPYGMGIQMTGPKATTEDGAPWALVNYQGLSGWVNTEFVAQQLGVMAPQPAKRASQIIMALKNGDLQTLSTFVHPQKGVRFSPYAFIRTQDLVIQADQFTGLFSNPTIYTWGVFDGSGAPIQMTFHQYYRRFIYDANFARPEMIGFNQAIGSGNSLNNILEFYPGDEFVEYHFSMLDPQYEGLDWRSLRIVLEQFNGEWYLVGVIHAEWTI